MSIKEPPLVAVIRRYDVPAQSRLWLRTAPDLLEASPRRHLIAETTDDEIVLRNGNRILAQPNTGRGTRGWACSLVVLDEFAWHVDSAARRSSRCR